MKEKAATKGKPAFRPRYVYSPEDVEMVGDYEKDFLPRFGGKPSPEDEDMSEDSEKDSLPAIRGDSIPDENVSVKDSEKGILPYIGGNTKTLDDNQPVKRKRGRPRKPRPEEIVDTELSIPIVYEKDENPVMHEGRVGKREGLRTKIKPPDRLGIN